VLSVIRCDIRQQSRMLSLGTRHPRGCATVGDRFLRRVFISRCWAAASGPSDDVVRDTIIEEMSQALFSVSPLRALGGYIIRPTKLSAGSAVSAVSVVQLRFRVVQLVVGDSRGKKLTGEHLTCD
jgi:hypothetical protein